MAGEPVSLAESLMPQPWRPKPLEDQEVIAAVQGLSMAAGKVLELFGARPDAFLQGELDEAMRPAAEGLAAIIDWMPTPDVETREVRAALVGWLS